MEKNEKLRWLKRSLKKKVSINLTTLIMFLMIGGLSNLSYSYPLEDNGYTRAQNNSAEKYNNNSYEIAWITRKEGGNVDNNLDRKALAGTGKGAYLKNSVEVIPLGNEENFKQKWRIIYNQDALNINNDDTGGGFIRVIHI